MPKLGVKATVIKGHKKHLCSVVIPLNFNRLAERAPRMCAAYDQCRCLHLKCKHVTEDEKCLG